MDARAKARAGSARVGLGLALSAIGGGTALLYAIPSLATSHPLLLGVAAFTPYAVAAWGGAVLCFMPSQRLWTRVAAAAAAAGLLTQVWWTRPYWPAPRVASDRASAATLITANLRCDERGVQDDLIALIGDVQPDLVVVHGVWKSAHASLSERWRHDLPHRVWIPMSGLPDCGTGVISRGALQTLPSVGGQPVLSATADVGTLTLLPVDFPTPTKGVHEWLGAFRDLNAAATAHALEGVIAAGDFNAVREHGPMRDLLNEASLRDAAETSGAGWQPTFPADRWFPPLIGLDHVLTSRTWVATDHHTERIRGHAHRVLVTRITASP